MKLFVQARKNGYNVLYPKPTPDEFYKFAEDIRPDSKDSNLLGKKIYTIAFADGGCIFTKYVIIDDVQRGAFGNIAFSIFIPNNKKLSGNDIVELLDELLNVYCENYCPAPNYKLGNVTENWEIFEAIKNKYNLSSLSYDDVENYQRGTAMAAFIYYIDKTELCNFFDNPYQEEYKLYKQVFFVEKDLEGKSDNPLSAISQSYDHNANLTGKIDLENPKYKLIYNQQAAGGVKIEVRVNGSLRYNKTKIKRKEDLQITWSKQYCETKIKKGKWYEIGSDFLEINDIEKTITVKEIRLNPIAYNLSIQTKDLSSNPITDAEITLKVGKYSPPEKVLNNTILITEEKLQNKCYISAKKGNLVSPQREIKLEELKLGVRVITLVLSEYKEVKFNVQDEKNNLVYNYDIKILNKEIQPKDGRVEFIGDEIQKTWQITVSHKDYETKQFDYCPAKDISPIYVKLTKRAYSNQGQFKKYYIKIDEKKGKRSYKGSPIEECTYAYPNFRCDSKYGYKFERWEPHENKPYYNYDGYYEAVFKNLWYRKVPKLAWIFIILAIVASTVFILVNSGGSGSAPSPDAVNKIDSAKIGINNDVNSYIEGIELNLDTLIKYKSQYCDSIITTNTTIQTGAKEKSWWQRIWIFGSKDNNASTNQTSAIPDLCSKIDDAIVLRRAINNGRIDELKALKYSDFQQNFKNAIDSIDDRYKKQIADTLYQGIVSKMDLNQIANLILKTQNDLRKKEEPEENVSQANKVENSPKANNNASQTNVKIATPDDALEKKFWDLMGKEEIIKTDFDSLFPKSVNYKNKYKIFYNNYLKTNEKFKILKGINAIKRKNIANTKKLEDLEKLIENEKNKL